MSDAPANVTFPPTEIDPQDVIQAYSQEVQEVRHALILNKVAHLTEQRKSAALEQELQAARDRIFALEAAANEPQQASKSKRSGKPSASSAEDLLEE